MAEFHSIRLKAATIARLRAAAETMGITTVDQLVEHIVLESLPTIEHVDLLGDATPAAEVTRGE